MNDLRQQEIFEIEILAWLKNKGFLKDLLFGGGTMLRLCHDLNRYSVDLDFWLYRFPNIERFYDDLKDALGKEFLITDTQNKFFTLLIEIKKASYPRKLKIEIRKELKEADFQEKIAYSRQANMQVLVKGFTLEQMMEYKTDALLERKEIRDAFDIEFLVRNGIALPEDTEKLSKMRMMIAGFKRRDYAVTLGSLLEPELRNYYNENGFSYLVQIINRKLSY